MHVINSLFSAFLMYSKIPMPKVEWKEENRRYALCFFPLIGGVIGGLFLLWYWICRRYMVEQLLFAVVAVLIPMLVTGGIHMDGYMDVSDAKACMGDRERMLAVMKDSRIGAFAVMYTVLYFLLQTGLFASVQSTAAAEMIGLAFIQSRAYSGLAAVTFRNAKKEGSLQNFSEPAHKLVTVCVEIIFILISWGLMLNLNIRLGLCGIIGGILTFIYYRLFSYKQFGGITGDLEGYFLQVSELVTMACVVLGSYLY